MRAIIALLLAIPLLPRVAAALRPGEVSTGTTILAVRYDGGVVVGADTRTSVSGYVSNRYAAKLTFVLDRNVDEFVVSSKGTSETTNGGGGEGASTCVICRSGSAADTQRLASLVRTELVSRQLMHWIRGTVTQAAALLRNVLISNEGMSASLICAGYDHDLRRGVIYTISPGGTVFEERSWAAGGSGSSYIIGHLDSCYPKEVSRKKLSEEEALRLVSESIRLAMERDGSSGGFVRMYVVDSRGKRFVSRMPRENETRDDASREGRINRQSALRLGNFAPAASPSRATSGS